MKPDDIHHHSIEENGSDPEGNGTGENAHAGLRLLQTGDLRPVSTGEEQKGGWSLGDFFTIKRGIETGDNEFFLVTPREVLAYNLPSRFLRPILPHPSLVPDLEIVADPEGYPMLEQKLYLLDCPLPEADIRRDYPEVWRYLEWGIERGVPERYSCRHRSPWYAQEKRPPAPFYCAYTGRFEEEDEAPFRFILNHSNVIAPNIYLMMYPRPSLARMLNGEYRMMVEIWSRLNSIENQEIIDRNIIYGNATGKLEPMELASVPARIIEEIFPDLVPDSAAQLDLFGNETLPEE